MFSKSFCVLQHRVCVVCAVERPRLFQACWLGSADRPAVISVIGRGHRCRLTRHWISSFINATDFLPLVPHSINNQPRSGSAQQDGTLSSVLLRLQQRIVTLFIQLWGWDLILVRLRLWQSLEDVAAGFWPRKTCAKSSSFYLTTYEIRSEGLCIVFSELYI